MTESWKKFMRSINEQNYTNYMVYLVDDLPEKKRFKDPKDKSAENIL